MNRNEFLKTVIGAATGIVAVKAEDVQEMREETRAARKAPGQIVDTWAQDVATIECDGCSVPVVSMRATMAEVKPSRGNAGAIWITRKPTGLLAYDRQGNVYWQENPGDPWENLSIPAVENSRK